MMGVTAEEVNLLDLAKYKITRMSNMELREFVQDLIPAAEAAKKEGANGPQSFRN